MKMYRGKDNHFLALHRNDDGVFHLTATPENEDMLLPDDISDSSWIAVDYLESLIYDYPELEIEPVALLVSELNGVTRYFEKTGELTAYYSRLGVDQNELIRIAGLLDKNIPIIFGTLKVYREKPWRFVSGLTARDRGDGMIVKYSTAEQHLPWYSFK